MSGFLKKIFWYPFNSKKRIDELQNSIRLTEWKAFEKYIRSDGDFLDVGCGAGHNLKLAKDSKKCKIQGIDPDPGAHGVGRFDYDNTSANNIVQGWAENLPYQDSLFDTVFCSHVLEHVNDEHKSLLEIKRVLKEDGIAIIGMPTATMAIINMLSSYIFTTHRNILFAIKSIGKKDFFERFKAIFIPSSHSYPRAKSVFYDLNHYRVKSWKKLISSEFQIVEVIEPLLYPYPDYIQFFKMHKNRFGSSSVFFICKK